LTLAYLTFGLQRTLCPEQRQTYPYSTNINGATVKVYRENVTVYGKVYPFKKMQSFLATKKLNLTKEYQGVDLSWIFDADMSGACKVYDVGRSGSTTTAGNCTIAGPYGMWLSIYACDVHLSFLLCSPKNLFHDQLFELTRSSSFRRYFEHYHRILYTFERFILQY
jgi:hypothetical protein